MPKDARAPAPPQGKMLEDAGARPARSRPAGGRGAGARHGSRASEAGMGAETGPEAGRWEQKSAAAPALAAAVAKESEG